MVNNQEFKMKINILVSLFTFLMIFISCDDSGDDQDNTLQTASGARSEMTGELVTYSVNNKNLFTTIKVVAKNFEGVTLKDKYVRLESSSELVNIENEFSITGETGEATFIITSNTLLDATITGFIYDSTEFVDGVQVDQIVNSEFNLSVSIIPLQSDLNWQEGVFQIRISVDDDVDSVNGANLTVSDASSTESSTVITTNSSGNATLSLTSQVTGFHFIDVLVEGIDNLFSIPIEFTGPAISGQIILHQTYPLGFVNARIAIMALNMDDASTINTGSPFLGEVYSESTCPCPGPADYLINLPVIAGDQYLNNNIASETKYGIFSLLVYDDLNSNHIWDNNEPIIAAKHNEKVLYFSKPTNPENQGDYFGWSIVDGVVDAPTHLDWEINSSLLDILVTRSPVYTPHIGGLVHNPENISNLRTGWFVVNSSAISNYTPMKPMFLEHLEIVKDPVNSVLLGDFSVSGGTYDGTLLDVANVLTSVQLENWKFTHMTAEGDNIEALMVVGVLYRDDNINQTIDGTEIVGGHLNENTTSGVHIYVLTNNNFNILKNPDELWFNLGYTLLQRTLYSRILTVSLQTPYRVFGFSREYVVANNTEFKVFAENDPVESTPVATGTISDITYSGTGVAVNSVDCTNCDLVNAGDKFSFYNPYALDEYGFVDWLDIDLAFY
jgi:hypothetical protein